MHDGIIKDYVADAYLISKKYPIHPYSIKLYYKSDNKSVWFIKAKDINYALKRYYLDHQQWQFMILAYNYLSQSSHSVATLISTKNNEPWVIHDNYYYILTSWVKGSMPDYNKFEDTINLTHSLASLHLYSKNFDYKDKKRDILPKNRIEENRRMQGLLLEYKYEAENNLEKEFASIYLKNYQVFFEFLEETIEIFEGPVYKNKILEIKKQPCLCVNNFSPHNFSLEKDKVWLLHLDNICIDLPARDIRKLLFKVMYIKNTWCKDTFSTIMQKYLEINPLAKEDLRIILAELKVPHLFFNISSKYFLKQKPHWDEEFFKKLLLKALRLEYEKLEVLYRFWRLI